MKIVYITSESFLDHSYTIAKELGRQANLVVYILAKEETEEIIKWCGALGAVFVKRKRYRNPLSFFTELKFLLSIRKQNADRVWFNTLNFYQLLLVRLILKKILVMVHDVEFHPELGDPFAVFSVKLTFALLKKKLCTASQTQASMFENKYGFRPRVFQLPVIDYYTDVASEKSAPKTENGLINFFFFGSIKHYKGIETLVEAAEILEHDGAKCRINVYGKFRYEARDIINRMGKIKILSLKDKFIRFDEVHSIFSENDVLILPYKHVTQCGPLLIGYNELVPSICNDLPGFREYVSDGKSGLLFGGSAEELAEKMELLIKKPELITEMKEYIRTEILKKFSIKNLRNNYISTIAG
jgi:glycosyltransferase involved in cell wall biosynthesis